MTWFECEGFYAFYQRHENELIKIYAVRNLETSRIAYHGQQNDVQRYVDKLTADNTPKENDFDDQFKGVKFEQQN